MGVTACVVCGRPATVATTKLAGWRQPVCTADAELARALSLPRMDTGPEQAA